jgi:hypothetical protein
VKKPRAKTFFIGELGLNLSRAVGNCPQEDCYACAVSAADFQYNGWCCRHNFLEEAKFILFPCTLG